MQVLALAVMSQYYIIRVVVYHPATVVKIVLAGCYSSCNQVTCASGGSRISRWGGGRGGGVLTRWGYQPPMRAFSVKMYAEMKEFGPIGGRAPGTPPRFANVCFTAFYIKLQADRRCLQNCSLHIRNSVH